MIGGAAGMLLRCLEAWPPEVGRQCLGLPEDEDPIAAVLRALNPEGHDGPTVAAAYGLSKQRVHQLESRALVKLVWPALTELRMGARRRGEAYARPARERA